MDLSGIAAYGVHAALLLAGLALGFGLGLRRNRSNNRRVQELRGQLENATKERELAQSELATARETIQKAKQEHADYRALVKDHFVGASDRLREFTMQYRAVYQHLAEGASALTEGFAGLEGSFEALAARAEPFADAPAKGRGEEQSSEAAARAEAEVAAEARSRTAPASGTAPGAPPKTSGTTPMGPGAEPKASGTTPMGPGAPPRTSGTTPMGPGAEPRTPGATPKASAAEPKESSAKPKGESSSS